VLVVLWTSGRVCVCVWISCLILDKPMIFVGEYFAVPIYSCLLISEFGFWSILEIICVCCCFGRKLIGCGILLNPPARRSERRMFWPEVGWGWNSDEPTDEKWPERERERGGEEGEKENKTIKKYYLKKMKCGIEIIIGVFLRKLVVQI